jgi:alkylation response protein AidB-like acyl-CoA dehydrogenase
MFKFDDEQLMIRQAIRQWVEARLRPANDALERGEVLPYDLMRDFIKTFGVADMARARLTRRLARAAKASDDDRGEGGLASGALEAITAIEFSRVSPGFYLCFGAAVGLAGGAIMARGTPEQMERWGLPLVTVEQVGAWGMTEPGAGSDAFGGMLTVATPDGDDYLLSGQKTFITNAPFADVLVVYAKIDTGDGTPLRERPFDAFIVEKGAPGLTLGKPMRKMGMHTSPTGEIFLDKVRVPRSQLLGGTPRAVGKAGARDVFHGERTGMAPMCLGIVEACLEKATAYARERQTWGRPIADYQLVQEKLARMFMHKQNIENLLFKQLWCASQRQPMSAAEASATKLYCARATTDCALEAIQILGGNGYMTEYHVEQLMRDAKLLQIGGGTDEIQILAIARQVLAGP